MLFEALSTLFMYFAISSMVECRDLGKTFKAIPTITNSLVNLGKMDVSIYFNARDPAIKSDGPLVPPTSTYLYSKSEPVMEPCPCSSLRGYKDPVSGNPLDFLNKLLISNDLFSYKEPTTSTLCCDSHEHDDYVTFDLGNKYKKPDPAPTNFGSIPLIIDSLLTKKPLSSLQKTKAVEIFFFPKKRESIYIPPKHNIYKNEPMPFIQAVGGKELRNEFASNMFKPTTSASVKKDLTAREKNVMEKIIETDGLPEVTTVANGNAL